MRLDASIVIDRPVGDVWRFYAVNHVQNHPRWDPDIQLEHTSDGPVGLGTLIRRRNSRSGKPVEESMEVVEFDPEHSMHVLIRDGPLQMNGFAIFASQDWDPSTLTVGCPQTPACRQKGASSAVLAKAVDACCDDYQESWGANPTRDAAKVLGSTDEQFE